MILRYNYISIDTSVESLQLRNSGLKHEHLTNSQYKGVFINIVFLNQNFLVQKEVISVLRTTADVHLTVLDITANPQIHQAELAGKILLERKCTHVFTVNEWGIDSEGILNSIFQKNGILHINWCVDDPFFEETMHRKKFKISEYRIDFVSDKDYLEKMTSRGYNAHFLPLGTDPAVFFPQRESFIHEISFVGNSYLVQLDSFISQENEYMHSMVPFLAQILREYKADNRFDLERAIEQQIETIRLPPDLPHQKAVFLCKHFTGYLYRKELVLTHINTYPDFVIYGDQGWLQFVDTSRLKKVSYGEGLRKVYNKTKINIDINRPVIKNGFTQRVFDALGCNSFLLTSAKPIIEDFFETKGDKKELITFKNAEELIDLIKFYREHETERNQIAQRGYEKVINNHTYYHRIKELFFVLMTSR